MWSWCISRRCFYLLNHGYVLHVSVVSTASPHGYSSWCRFVCWGLVGLWVPGLSLVSLFDQTYSSIKFSFSVCFFGWGGLVSFLPSSNCTLFSHGILKMRLELGLIACLIPLPNLLAGWSQIICQDITAYICFWHSVSDEMKQKICDDDLLQKLHIRLRKLQQSSQTRDF